MNLSRHRPRTCLCALALALAAAGAGAAASPAGAAETTPPVTPPVTTPSPPAPPVPAPAYLKLRLLRAGGHPSFAMLRHRVLFRGLVTPFVAGQTVKVSIYRDGRKVAVKTLPVVPNGKGQGKFQLSYVSHAQGLVQARVAHYATPLQLQFTGRSEPVQYVAVNLGPGSSGASVRLLQSELNQLHYEVPLSGVFDEGTSRALVAFRKVTGMSRIAYAGRTVLERIFRGGGHFHVHYPQDGRHVEANLTKQVLAEIEPGGRVRRIYEMSSGKPSTPTVIGHFYVYSKTFGVNEKGMVDSNYFIRGYAIHGYPEVPTYAASHGCLRVPIPNAAAIYGWVQYGTPVDVYHEGGGGSNKVRGNAGP